MLLHERVNSFDLCLKGADGRQLRLAAHVGFDSLPDQLVNKSVKRGFSFNVLCIGMCKSFYVVIVTFLCEVDRESRLEVNILYTPTFKTQFPFGSIISVREILIEQ